MFVKFYYLFLLLLLLLLLIPFIKNCEGSNDSGSFQVGVGIWDITGPAAQVGMMGYAMFDQTTAGIHLRLRARAFIISDGIKRIVFVSVDSCMIFTGVKDKVIELLGASYGDLYRQENVLLSGTHTHSGPAGYAYEALYDMTSWGFQKENFDTIVNGIVNAIKEAHSHLRKDGRIFINSGELLDSNLSRSPTAYLANPSVERAQYKYDVDKLMTVMRIEGDAKEEVGAIAWFAVHGTSMNNTNKLISSDNKGFASYLFEKRKNPENLPGTGPFVCAFAQSNEGDSSPNTRGAFCPDGSPCEAVHSSCVGLGKRCQGYGPGSTDFESMEIIGTNQFKRALQLYESISVELQPPIDYVHTFVDFSNLTVSSNWSSTGRDEHTCHGSLGDSFAAGATDGPGDFNFKQGTNDTTTNPYWNFLASFISDPTPEEIACQAPKPILLNTGDIDFPVPWTPAILPLQILRIGDLFLLGVPAELTTMSGRRLRHTVMNALNTTGIANNNTQIIIAGLANAYAHYVTTYEEYAYQRYEGASTLYGPHTLAAYQQEFSSLAVALAKGLPVPHGPTPPNLEGKTPSFQAPVLFDEHPLESYFGAIKTDVSPAYSVGDTVSVQFWGANPRNDYRIQDTFLAVERNITGDGWKVVLTDGDPDTKFFWSSHLYYESIISVTWDIAPDTPSGTYRIRTFGKSKDISGKLTPYVGSSSPFTVK